MFVYQWVNGKKSSNIPGDAYGEREREKHGSIVQLFVNIKPSCFFHMLPTKVSTVHPQNYQGHLLARKDKM
jgi:hypothetical protein